METRSNEHRESMVSTVTDCTGALASLCCLISARNLVQVSDLQHEVGARCEHIMTKVSTVAGCNGAVQSVSYSLLHILEQVSDLNYEVKVPTTKDVSTASEWQRERWRQRKLKIQQLQWRRQQQ